MVFRDGNNKSVPFVYPLFPFLLSPPLKSLLHSGVLNKWTHIAGIPVRERTTIFGAQMGSCSHADPDHYRSALLECVCVQLHAFESAF